MTDLFAAATERIAAVASRNAALAKVWDNSDGWAELAMIELREKRLSSFYQQHKEFTNNQIKQWVVPNCGAPPSPNCWGALVMRCIRERLIEDTGKISRTGANARKQTVYRWA